MKHAMKLTLAIAAAAFTAPPVSMAQEGADDTIALDEVIVSARKRSESLQDVPIAVDVFNEMKLELLGIDNVEELARYTPSLTYDRGVLPMDTRPVIRGATAQRGRPNVGILVDYVDVSSESLTVAGGGITSNLRLLDLERVEIIKGPQNALYGRSAFTGAINYVTKRPSDSFSGKRRSTSTNMTLTKSVCRPRARSSKTNSMAAWRSRISMTRAITKTRTRAANSAASNRWVPR